MAEQKARKLFWLIKMCLNKICTKVWVVKHLPGVFLIQSGLKQGDALSRILFTFALEYAIREV
jgi:hypothetical protein